MSDSWEDDEVDIKLNLNEKLNVSTVPSNWDDEDETIKEVVVLPPAPTAAQIEAARKKKEEEEEMLARKIQLALIENETPEERRIRERKQAEEADGQLAGEMFGNGKADSSDAMKTKKNPSVSSGLAGLALKTKEDHTKFGIAVSAKLLESSTPFHISLFLKECSDRVKEKLTVECLDDIIHTLQAIKDTKKKAEAPVRAKPVSKAALKQKEKKHNDVFGGGFDDHDRHADYSNLEDNFM